MYMKKIPFQDGMILFNNKKKELAIFIWNAIFLSDFTNQCEIFSNIERISTFCVYVYAISWNICSFLVAQSKKLFNHTNIWDVRWCQHPMLQSSYASFILSLPNLSLFLRFFLCIVVFLLRSINLNKFMYCVGVYFTFKKQLEPP